MFLKSVLVAMLALTPAYALALDPTSESDVAAQIRKQADAWDVALVTKNAEAIAANMGEAFTQIDSNGGISNAEAFISNMTDPKLTIEPYVVQDYVTRFYGGTAVITGRVEMKGSYDGKPFTSHYRFTDVYAQTGGVWKVVNVQTTRVKEK